ncbi:MAG: glycosyltransferase family 4 protein [Sedimentisphaerales bacterium]|nr:glycosyltransferase family 4 protein [Sedimentisphaerales bacterium]
MELVVDGIIYRLQSKGGISRLFTEILPRMCEMDDSLHISLLTQGRLMQSLPEHRHIEHRSVPAFERYLRPNCVWQSVLPRIKRFMYNLWTGTGEGKIWHSTYYTMPEKWAGYSVATVHDMVFELFPQFYSGPNFDSFRQKKRLSVQQADAVICVSDATRQDVLRFYELDANKVRVIPNACSDIFRRLDDTEATADLQIEQPFLLYVGIRSPYKNFGMLIQAYRKWRRQKEVALVLVGARPWSDDERRQLAQLQIQNRVQLLQDVDDETLCRLYNSAAAFVFPSLYEGFGIPLLEAMACGCPIVASHIPSTIEVAGDCPIYFDLSEEDDLLNALDIALSEGRNSERVREGLKRVKSYSWDRTAAQTLEVYRNIYA